MSHKIKWAQCWDFFGSAFSLVDWTCIVLMYASRQYGPPVKGCLPRFKRTGVVPPMVFAFENWCVSVRGLRSGMDDAKFFPKSPQGVLQDLDQNLKPNMFQFLSTMCASASSLCGGSIWIDVVDKIWKDCNLSMSPEMFIESHIFNNCQQLSIHHLTACNTGVGV